MKENILIDKLRTGDIIGTAPWWHNRFYNFFKLWILKDRQYAKRYWKDIVPTRFYVACRRESDLMYGATVYKKLFRAKMSYASLKKLGSVVFVGRQQYFNSFSVQNELNTELANLHYFMVTQYNRKKAKSVYGISDNGKLNIGFAIYVMSIGDDSWKEMLSRNHFKPKALDVIELGDFERI